MKIYFFEDGKKSVMDFSNTDDEPECVASFEIENGKSFFAPRYEMVDKKLVDKYVGKSDEDVALILQKNEIAKAKEIEEKLKLNAS